MGWIKVGMGRWRDWMAFLKARDGSRMATEDQYRRIKAEKAKLEKALDRACEFVENSVAGGLIAYPVGVETKDDLKQYFLEGGE